MKRENIIIFWLIVFLVPMFIEAGTLVSQKEARAVAGNWLAFVVARDGTWGGSHQPVVDRVIPFSQDGVLLGYCVSVKPQGYMVISSLKGFAPIKAYSTVCNLDLQQNGGAPALLKDVLAARARFLSRFFGGLDEEHLKDLNQYTLAQNRELWQALIKGQDLLNMHIASAQAAPGAQTVGPLLKTRWSQHPPYNYDCPDMGCHENVNTNAPVGCIPLAIAQVMRYYCWPPFFEGQQYEWENMMVNEAHYSAQDHAFYTEDSRQWTLAEISAVADLCRDPGRVLDADYSCSGTGAYFWAAAAHDARDAFEDDFYYDTAGNEPEHEDRDDYSYEEWWQIIKDELDHNRPVLYGIEQTNDDYDFEHSIVVDGYDVSTGQYKVHANYGWGLDWHTFWYDLDWFDCAHDTAWSLRCDWDEEMLIRYIYPRNGLCGSFTGVIGPWGGAGTLHNYIYCDVTSNNMTIQGGARVQFLPGVSLTCSGNSIRIEGHGPGGVSGETRLFTNGLPTRGVRIGSGAGIKLSPNGALALY